MHWDKPQAGREPSPARLEAWEKLEGPAFAALPYLMLVIASALEIALSGFTAALPARRRRKRPTDPPDEQHTADAREPVETGAN